MYFKSNKDTPNSPDNSSLFNFATHLLFSLNPKQYFKTFDNICMQQNII